jgi:ELWxxDGT repeat protein
MTIMQSNLRLCRSVSALPVLLSFLLLPHPAAAGDLVPRLVRDVDRTTYAASSSPRQLSGVNDGFAFTAFGNRELWFYDGKEDDFTLGLKHREIRQLVDGIYAAREESGGWTLWVVDGFPYFQVEPLGTPPIARIGRAYQSPSGYGTWLFEADAGHGLGLWSLDGSTHAHEVARPLPFSDGLLLHDITLYRNRTFFVARDRHLGTALWAADGTAAGTSPVFAPSPEKTVSMILAGVVRNRLLLAVSGVAGSAPALWLSDGTPHGTRRLVAIGPGGRTAGITDAMQIPLTDRIVFVADDGRHGKQLWGTDGTADGTKRLTNFPTADPFAGSPLSAATLAGRLAFFADDGVHGREIWSTDGTPAGTRLLVDACPGACGMAGDILLTLQAVDTPPQPERLLFSSHLPGGVDLWATDGTAAGTGLLAGICSGACDGEPRGIADGYFPFSTAGPGTTFTAATPAGERALWFTDGTAQGTRKLTPPGATVASTDPLTVSDAEFGDEFWTTDGTPEGTHLWRDLGQEIDSGSHPAFLGTVGDRVLFSAFTPAHGIRLYASDGTAAGTLPLALPTLPTPAPDLSVLAQSATAAGRTLFTAWVRGTEKAALWGADTTGAVRLTPAGVTVSGGPFSLGQHAVFFAADAEHGSEPWVSDGTPESTHLLADLVPGADQSSDGTGAQILHGQLLFSRWDDSQPWITDGTVEGTRRLFDAYPFLAPSGNVQLPLFTEVPGKLYFAGADAPNGQPELWVSDWTAAGTHSFGFPGTGLGVAGIFPVGSRLFVFVAATDASAPQPVPLWLVDPLSGAGTPASLAADFRFGTLPPIAYGDHLVLSDEDDHLWVTDGTAAGTFPLQDPAGQEIVLSGGARAISFAGRLIASVALASSVNDFGPCYIWDGNGATASTPAIPAAGVLCNGDFFPVGSRLYFTGYQPDTGAEPWVFEDK